MALYPISHRDPDAPQIEICDICGLRVERASLIRSEVEGLQGRVVCGKHTFESMARLRPSYRDYRKLGPRPVQQVPERLPPHGDEDKYWDNL